MGEPISGSDVYTQREGSQERARALLESIALLETVGADREAKVEEILDRLPSAA